MKVPGGRKAILVIVPVLLAGAGLGYTQVAAGGTPVHIPTPDPAAGEVGPLLALDSRVVNLKTGGAYRYAKIALTVELRPADASFYKSTAEARTTAEKAVVADYTAEVPMLLDLVGQVVAAKSSDDLNSAAGRASLKTELLAAIRGDLGQDAVLDIFLTDFVMQ